jgi:hypothetical protein
MENNFKMIDLYYWGTPNGHKITIALEEMGLDYQIFPINILENDQFQPDFYVFRQIIKFQRLLIKMDQMVNRFLYLNQVQSYNI